MSPPHPSPPHSSPSLTPLYPPSLQCYLLSVMPDTVLDAICERLKHRLYINNTVTIREGYPVFRCFFLLRGQLQSITTNKGRTGFFEEVILGKGDFVGEELLVWFIEKYAETKKSAPKSFSRLVSSKRGLVVASKCLCGLGRAVLVR